VFKTLKRDGQRVRANDERVTDMLLNLLKFELKIKYYGKNIKYNLRSEFESLKQDFISRHDKTLVLKDGTAGNIKRKTVPVITRINQ
jgi:hypothetical protein